MDLQEEYFRRRKIKGFLVKFVDHGAIILRARRKEVEREWLHITIQPHNEANHPQLYHFVIATNPIVLSNSDLTNFNYHTKMVEEHKLQFNDYEGFILDWTAKIAPDYEAVNSRDAMLVSWNMFCANYDQWLANFLSWHAIDLLHKTLVGPTEERIKNIQQVEGKIQQRHDRVFQCWRNIKNNLEQKNYADWLAEIINATHDHRIPQVM